MRRLLLILPLFVTVSCSSGATSGILALLTGTWTGRMVATNDPDPAGGINYSGDITMRIEQDEFGFLTGIISISDPETGCWTGGEIDETSTITGSRVLITFADTSGSSVTFDATASNNSMNGLYSSTAGGTGLVPCTPSSGTLRLNRA